MKTGLLTAMSLGYGVLCGLVMIAMILVTCSCRSDKPNVVTADANVLQQVFPHAEFKDDDYYRAPWNELNSALEYARYELREVSWDGWDCDDFTTHYVYHANQWYQKNVRKKGMPESMAIGECIFQPDGPPLGTRPKQTHSVVVVLAKDSNTLEFFDGQPPKKPRWIRLSATEYESIRTTGKLRF